MFAMPNLALKQIATEVHAKMTEDDYPGIGSLTFDTPQALFPLQAADLMAFEIYHQLRSSITHGLENFETRPALQRFHQSRRPMKIGYFDDERMQRVVTDVRRHFA